MVRCEAIREARSMSTQIAVRPNETQRMIDRYPLLLREAFILGEDRGISLNRPDEAAALLREAFDMHEAGARRDPDDYHEPRPRRHDRARARRHSALARSGRGAGGVRRRACPPRRDPQQRRGAP